MVCQYRLSPFKFWFTRGFLELQISIFDASQDLYQIVINTIHGINYTPPHPQFCALWIEYSVCSIWVYKKSYFICLYEKLLKIIHLTFCLNILCLKVNMLVAFLSYRKNTHDQNKIMQNQSHEFQGYISHSVNYCVTLVVHGNNYKAN